MSIASYSDLVAAVAEWMARDDLNARIPDWITLAEAKFNRDLRCRQMEKRAFVTVSLTDTERSFVPLPSDFQTMRSLIISNDAERRRLRYLEADQIKDYRSNIGNVNAQPVYFGVFGDQLELAPNPLPSPATAPELEMIYRANLPSLSASNPTNWLLNVAPDAYLYGTLLESEPYMHDDARIPVWVAGLKQAIAGLSSTSEPPTNDTAAT